MDIEEELVEFLENIPRRVGQRRLDGSPRKMAEPNPALQRRNQLVILSYYDFGDEDTFWPTYEELGERYDKISRERIRQIIERNYIDQLDGALPIAVKVAEVLAQKEFWTERDFLDEIEYRGLAGRFSFAVGIVRYLQSQGLAGNYRVCLPSLKEATRGTYFDHEERVILTKGKLQSLQKDLDAAVKVPGQVGLGNLRHVRRPRATVDHEALKSLLRLSSNVWCSAVEGEFWYVFEDRAGNSLINAAEKTFAIVESVPLDALSEMLHHSLYRRKAPTEFPSVELIRTWITQSRHFAVTDGEVQFKGTASELVEGEQALVEVMRGKGALPTSVISKALIARGLGSATVNKLVFNSPLVFVDRSQGRLKYLVTLATDLPLRKASSASSRYDRFKQRLAAIGKTTRRPREPRVVSSPYSRNGSSATRSMGSARSANASSPAVP